MQRTGIEWTDFSANPLKYRDAAGKVVWGCVKTSPGCSHCYSEALARRYGRGGPFSKETMRGLTPFLDDAELHRMLACKPAAGKRCFVGDMTDVFGEWVPDELLDRLFAVFALRPDVTWQVLTKRAERMREYLGSEEAYERIQERALTEWPEIVSDVRRRGKSDWSVGRDEEGKIDSYELEFPLSNVWCGFSAENQECYDRRAVEMAPLMRAGWTVCVSAEPLLGPIDLWDDSEGVLRGPAVIRDGYRTPSTPDSPPEGVDASYPGVDWVIVGGESGPGARPCQVEWIRSIVQQCQAANVSCFVKQLGSRPVQEMVRPGCSVRVALEPMSLLDPKGGNIDEFPADLRVRQFPEPHHAAHRS